MWLVIWRHVTLPNMSKACVLVHVGLNCLYVSEENIQNTNYLLLNLHQMWSCSHHIPLTCKCKLFSSNFRMRILSKIANSYLFLVSSYFVSTQSSGHGIFYQVTLFCKSMTKTANQYFSQGQGLAPPPPSFLKQL